MASPSGIGIGRGTSPAEEEHPSISRAIGTKGRKRMAEDSIRGEESTRTALTAGFPAQDRLRFAQFVLERLPNGRCRAKVELTWRESERFSGESEGLASQAGEHRCAAEATVQALTQSVEGSVAFELLGVKAVRAFDATVVIVSLSVQADDRTHRVVGSYLSDTEPARGAALAVLNATNRILGNRLFMR
jgi:hypothetical protein